MRRIAAAILLTLGLTGALLFGGLATASAQPSPTSDCYPSCPTNGTVPTDPGTVATAQTTASGQLAFTGADIAGFVVVGLLLIGGGVLVVTATRRRRAAS